MIGYHLRSDFYEDITEKSHVYNYRQVILKLSGNPSQDVNGLRAMKESDLYFDIYNEITYVI